MTQAEFREPGTEGTENENVQTGTDNETTEAPMSDAERDATGEDDN